MDKRFLFFLAICFLALNLNLGSWGITETSEARYAEISKEMFESNDYLNPTLLGIKHYHKPVVTYYITAAGYTLFGVNEYGSRFFLQIAIILQLIFIYQITQLLFKDRDVSLSASLIYFSLPIVLISSRNLTTDDYLNTFILGSIFAWLSFSIKNKNIYIYLFFIVLGLAMETKGPVALLFPLTFIITYKLVLKQKLKVNRHHVLGFILFLIISTLWYVALIINDPNIWNYFIEEQLVNRITSNSYNRGKPFWYYLVLIPAVSFPWIFIIGYHVINRFKELIKKRSLDFVFIASTVILTTIFSMFKTKLILYVLPMFGFIAIVSALILKKSNQRSLAVYNSLLLGLSTLIMVIISGAHFLLSQFNFNIRHSLIFGIPLVLVLYFLYHKTFVVHYLKPAVLSFILGLTILMFGTSFLIENESLLNSTKPVFEFVKQELPNKQKIVVYNYLLPSAKFYFDKPIITLNNGHNTVKRETQFEANNDWKQRNIDIRTENGMRIAKAIIDTNTVIVARKKFELSEKASDLTSHLTHSKTFGNWIIYY